MSSLHRSFWLKICWHLRATVKKTATIWAVEEMVAQREEMITSYEDLGTVAVFMAITRGLALRLQENRITAKAVRSTAKAVRSTAKVAARWRWTALPCLRRCLSCRGPTCPPTTWWANG